MAFKGPFENGEERNVWKFVDFVKNNEYLLR